MKSITRLKEIKKNILEIPTIVRENNLLAEKQGILLRVEDERELLEKHRSQDILTCPENCFCWKLDILINKSELLR